MEDAHTTILNLNKDTPSDASHVSFFAVFDGHGGPSVAQYAGERLHFKVAAQPAYKARDYREALRTAFFALDDDITNGLSLFLY
jgi:protein phosphatase 2C family protein 2/3